MAEKNRACKILDWIQNTKHQNFICSTFCSEYTPVQDAALVSSGSESKHNPLLRQELLTNGRHVNNVGYDIAWLMCALYE